MCDADLGKRHEIIKRFRTEPGLLVRDQVQTGKPIPLASGTQDSTNFTI